MLSLVAHLPYEMPQLDIEPKDERMATMRQAWVEARRGEDRPREGIGVWRTRAVTRGVLTLAVSGALSGCYGPESERLSCGDVLAPDIVDFQGLVALVRDPAKGCLVGPCHTGDAQAQGLRLDTSALVYEEMSTRADDMYAMLASGRMPEDGTPWTDDDLRLFRSWYCSGAFPP